MPRLRAGRWINAFGYNPLQCGGGSFPQSVTVTLQPPTAGFTQTVPRVAEDERVGR